MPTLSKSQLISYRQCPRRLWLDVHRPALREDSSTNISRFEVGQQVGEVARRLYDPDGAGVLIEPKVTGLDAAFTRTKELLQSAQPIFEAGFRAEGVQAFADLMLPVEKDGTRVWRMIEVKSSASVKDYHCDDVAVQAFLARSAGVSLVGIAIACIDSQWVYPGEGDYCGLLRETDLTAEAFSHGEEVRSWIAAAQQVVAEKQEPHATTGRQCKEPYECGFLDHCRSMEPPQTEHPIGWLPGRLGSALQAHIAAHNLIDMQDVPDELLNGKQQRVKAATLTGEPFFNQRATAEALAGHELPAYFLDFETIQFAVPIWKGTRPYQQVPFQFSLDCLSRVDKCERQSFLDLSGNDPSREFAEILIAACGESGPIFVYNAGFETARIRDLADRFTDLARQLSALKERIVDLLPVVREHYYHPSQEGSWSIKKASHALCPDLSYKNLKGVQDGSMAMDAYREALKPQTSAERKAEIERQLLKYCGRDTWAMVRMWSELTGRALINLDE